MTPGSFEIRRAEHLDSEAKDCYSVHIVLKDGCITGFLEFSMENQRWTLIRPSTTLNADSFEELLAELLF